MILSDRYNEALLFAHECHRSQRRKQTGVPYISHPMAVSSLVLEYGGSENEAVAALLHDVLEDVGVEVSPEIESRFGADVLRIVVECSDVLVEEGGNKGPWRERKERYLERIPGKSEGALLVTACDKLHNLTAIVRDFHVMGDEVWKRFAGRQNGTRWYYENLVHRFIALELAPAADLDRKLAEVRWRPRRYPAPVRLA